MNRSSTRIRLMAFFCLVFFLIKPGLADEKTKQVDKLFEKWDTTVTPGAALAVIKDGEIIYKRGYGMAKLEDGLVITPSKIFDIGSVSKQFTATCLAMLVREGKISLDDDIRKHVPELPAYEKPVTIRHLLHHTSGLRDYNALLSLAGFRPDADSPTVEESIEILAKQKRLNYSPGEEYSYTNSGYFLMGVIVERVAGKSLNQFAQERIFQPLGMKNTFFQDDHNQIVKNRASGYSPKEEGFQLDLSNWDQVGDGNVYTSVEDLYLWDQAFYNNKLGKELMDMLHTPGVLNNGNKLDYAFGLVIGNYKGLKTVGHGGAWAGYRAGLIRFPEQKFSVICLSNLSTFNPSALCLRVADIYLAGVFKEEPKKEPVKKIKPFLLSQEALAEKAGNYKDQKFGMWVTVSVKEDKLKIELMGEEFLLAPVSERTFQTTVEGTDVIMVFEKDKRGTAEKANLARRGREEIKLIRAASVSPLTPVQLREYEGEYQSEELLSVVYKIMIDKENLYVKFRGSSPSALKLMAPEQFTSEGLNFEFVRDQNKEVTGFSVSVGRAANIEFKRRS